MPGKSQQSTRGKQDSSKERLSSASSSESSRKVTIWPEWTEAELAAEKWDLGGGKGRAKSSAVFEDPEGALLPPSLLACGKVIWKRPTDAAVLSTGGDEAPVIVLDPDCCDLDFISANSHLMHSEFVCWFLSQLSALWENRHILSAVEPAGDGGGGEAGATYAWRPWEHIQPHSKGTPAPQVNPAGKYCVKLYWMGCWHKVSVDDLLPYIEQPASSGSTAAIYDSCAEVEDSSGAANPTAEVSTIPLYPRTANHVELWPVIIMKAVLKIAALDYSGGNELSELGDCSLIHMLTGWTPLILPIKMDSIDDVWNSLVDLMPVWRRDDPDATDEQRKQKKCLVLAGFTSIMNKSCLKPFSASQMQNLSASEAVLKEVNLIPLDYSLHSQPSFPMLLSQVRDEPLVLPPAEPPLPVLQAPFYLGLKHRVKPPGEPTPPPTPPPVEPRFVEVVAPFLSKYKEERVEQKELSSGEMESDKSAIEDETEANGSSEAMQKTHDCNQEKGGEKVWMDYLDFVKGFQTLYVFKCSTNFEHRESFIDLSQTIEGTARTGGSAPASKKTASANQLGSVSKVGTSTKPQNMLFVDSPDPVTLHVVFASLSNWREGQRNTHTTTQRHPTSLSSTSHPRPSSTPTSVNGSAAAPPAEPQSESDEGCREQALEREYVIGGSLIAEEYSWRSIQSGKFLLRLTTTGTKGTIIKLPPGRHVFKLHVRTPIGHHLEIFSRTPFVLTDQDGIFSHLNKETSLYLCHGVKLIKTLLLAASSLSSGERNMEESLQPLIDFYSQFSLTKDVVTILLASMLQAWAKQAAQYGLNNKMQFAWKAFLYKAFTILKQQVPSASPESSVLLSSSHSIAELRRQLQLTTGNASEDKTTSVPESWADREATAKEEHATRVIQRSLRHHLARHQEQSMITGTASHSQALQELQQSIPLIEPSVEELGSLVLRGLFKLSPSLLDKFPFCKDEKTRGFSTVYTGAFPPLPPNSWTIVFREVFHIKKAQCVVPYFECPISSYLFRVIDNDTNSEVPRVFHSTPPRIYQPNARGYTFQAEAWNNSTEGILLEEGRWSLRIVSSNQDLPEAEGEPTNEELTSTFYSKEVVDYCLPDRDGCIFRYFLKVTQDCPVSVQLCTSKQDAICKLELLDNDVSKAETKGRGNCTIPLYLLEANEDIETKEGDTSSNTDPQPHKYVVRATILRDSWPVSESAWPYISMIKSMEKLEERPGSKPGSAKKGRREKGAVGKKGATPQQSSSQLNQVTDKPHWILRIVTKSNDKEVLEVKKDTERADNLKSMMQAWEVEQPGRTKKAQESRQKFLDARAIKESSVSGPSTEEDQSNVAVSVISEGSTTVPHPNTGPVKIIQMDLSPYIVKHEGPAKLFDEQEEKARLQERQKLFKDYRTKRHEVIQIRNADREQRNEAKVKQLEQAEQWQVSLDELRNKLNAGREAIRERHLAKERARQEAEMAALKAQEEQQAAAGRESKMAKGAKGKGKKK